MTIVGQVLWSVVLLATPILGIWIYKYFNSNYFECIDFIIKSLFYNPEEQLRPFCCQFLLLQVLLRYFMIIYLVLCLYLFSRILSIVPGDEKIKSRNTGVNLFVSLWLTLNIPTTVIYCIVFQWNGVCRFHILAIHGSWKCWWNSVFY